MKFEATFLVPNPLFPSSRAIGKEQTQLFASKEEARAIATLRGYEILCIRPL